MISQPMSFSKVKCQTKQSPYSNCCLSRSEQFFGSPSETAAAAEGVRERLLLVEERQLHLQEVTLHNGEDKEEEVEVEVLNGQEGRLDVIGEEMSEKEEQDEEKEEAGRQDEDSGRATQDC